MSVSLFLLLISVISVLVSHALQHRGERGEDCRTSEPSPLRVYALQQVPAMCSLQEAECLASSRRVPAAHPPSLDVSTSSIVFSRGKRSLAPCGGDEETLVSLGALPGDQLNPGSPGSPLAPCPCSSSTGICGRGQAESRQIVLLLGPGCTWGDN